jgi:hypothetical protein
MALAWLEIAALESREAARFYVERGRGRRRFAEASRARPRRL